MVRLAEEYGVGGWEEGKGGAVEGKGGVAEGAELARVVRATGVARSAGAWGRAGAVVREAGVEYGRFDVEPGLAALDSDSTLVPTRDPGPQPTPDLDTIFGDPEAQDTETLGESIVTLSAHLHAGNHRLLVMVAEFDRRGGWKPAGHRSCAHWLAFRTGISLGPARERVRAARALEQLPLTSEAMSRGELSFSKVRALSRVADDLATPEEEETLVEFARQCTAAQLETLVRGWKKLCRKDEIDLERERHRSRFFSVSPDEDGMYLVRGRLDPEVGALLMRARESVTEQPALQDEAEPVDDAPIEIEPTPPATAADAMDAEAADAAQAEAPPTEAVDGEPAEVEPALAEVPAPEVPDDTRDGLMLNELDALPGPPISLAEERPGGFELPVELLTLDEDQESLVELPATPGVASPASPARDDWLAQWLRMMIDDRPRPTAAPRAEQAVDPVRLDESNLRRAGEMLVGEGVEITTARARLGIASRLTARPRDVKFEITFRAGDGRATDAKLHGSTGYRDFDAAIRSSLYRWRAAGPEVDDAEADIVLEWTYRFE